MALSLSRNAKLYISTSQTVAGLTNANTFEVSVLDGFQFTAATSTQEIEISEAGATPTRGQQVFTTAIEPVEWSIQAYMRPRFDALDAVVDAVERILWEGLAASPVANSVGTGTDGNATTRQGGGSGGLAIDFTDSNTNELLQLSFIFNLGTAAAPTWYHIVGGVVNTAEIDFGIEDIASISWTGFGTSVVEVTDSADLASLAAMLVNTNGDWQDSAFPDGTDGYLAAPTGTQACIRNKLSTVSLVGASGQVGIGGNTYTLALTGGSLTINNNITFLTPEALGAVNLPCGHFTGTRAIGGEMTAYLKTGGSNDTGDLLNDLLTYSNDAAAGANPTQFALDIYVGGIAPVSPFDTPVVALTLPAAHLVIPTINIEDVVAVSIPFTGLPYTGTVPDPDATNELTVAYYADET